MATIENKVGGFMGKSKALALAGIVGLTGAVKDAYSQAFLSFSGPTSVQVGVPIEFNLTVNTTAGNVNTAQIGSVAWQLGLTNSSNATINSISTPSSNDVFNGLTVSNSYNLILGNSNVRDVISGTGPSNIASKNYATATVTFNSPGTFTWSYGFGDVQNNSFISLPTNFGSTYTVSAVPEPSTYAALAGGLALGAAALLRRRKKSN